MYSFNYDILHATMLQQRISGVLQRAVLRHRVRVPDLQLRRRHAVADSRRPPLLPVVHARRPRQLLAVQRRDERRAALSASPMSATTLVTGAAGFAGSHLLDLLGRATAPRPSSRGTGPAARRRATRRRRTRWEAVDLLDRDAVRDGDRARRARPSCTTAPAPRTSAARGIAPSRTFAINVRGTHHLLDALRARRRRARAC